MEHVVTIIVACVTACIGVIITYLLTRLYASDSLLPGSDKDAKDAFSHISRTWFSHHISLDHTKTKVPYWQRGELELEIVAGGRVLGIQRDYNSAHDTYNILGKIRNGQMFLAARAQNDAVDSYLAHFVNLRRNTVICGLWVGVNYEHDPFCGAYILSDEELSLSELNSISKNHRIGAAIIAQTIWRNDIEETTGIS